MSAEPRKATSHDDAADRIGLQLPVLRRHVSQSMIDDYAKASGDFNPIHVDPDYAKTGPYGRTIGHGLMTLAFVGQLLNQWSDGRFDGDGELDIAFTGPVFDGDTVDVTGRVVDIAAFDGRPAEVIEISCMAGDRRVLAGKAHLPLQTIRET